MVILRKVEQLPYGVLGPLPAGGPSHEGKSETGPQAPHRQALLRPGRGWPLRFLGVPTDLNCPQITSKLLHRASPSEQEYWFLWSVGWLSPGLSCSRVKVRVSQSSFRLSQLCRESSSRPSELGSAGQQVHPRPSSGIGQPSV